MENQFKIIRVKIIRILIKFSIKLKGNNNNNNKMIIIRKKINNNKIVA